MSTRTITPRLDSSAAPQPGKCPRSPVRVPQTLSSKYLFRTVYHPAATLCLPRPPTAPDTRAQCRASSSTWRGQKRPLPRRDPPRRQALIVHVRLKLAHQTPANLPLLPTRFTANQRSNTGPFVATFAASLASAIARPNGSANDCSSEFSA